MSNVTVALLASLAYFISYAGNWAFGQCMLERPICVGAITGLLLGDPTTGVIMGGALEAIYMGAVNIGGATAAEPVSATVLAVAFAISSGLGMEEALALAVPVGLVFNSLGLVLFMLGNAFLPWYSKACDTGNSKAIDQILWSNWLVMYGIRTVIIFFSVYLGSAVVAAAMANLPPQVLGGLGVASGLIGAVCAIQGYRIFGGRLSITPEFYWNTTKDLLYDSTIPSVSGYTRQMQNIGKVQNNGWELTVNGDIVRGKDYVVSANFTLGHNKMTIKKLNATDNIIYNYYSGWYSSSQQDYVLEVGNELGLFYGYKYDGLYTWDEFTYPANENYLAVPKNKGVVNGIIIGGTVTDGYENNSGNGVLSSSNSGYSTLPGKIKIKDLNGDGQIDENDRTVIGRTTPKWQGGFGLSGQWKDFDFSANFVYMLDFDVYNANAYALSSSSSSQYNFWNAYAKFAGSDRWRYTDPVTGECLYKAYYLDDQPNVYRALNANTAKYWNPADVVNNIMLDYFVEDGSFIRCTDVTIGYTLPANLTKKIGINKVRAYVSGSNLFILTKYSGYDPEVDIQSGLTPNMDWCRYPRNRSFSFGLNVTF